jgi:N-formylglutamate amidohydrolase
MSLFPGRQLFQKERKYMSDEDGTYSAGVWAADLPAPTLRGFNMPVLPDWVLFHVPHDSTFIPPSERSKLLLNDAELRAELLSMTDHWTFDLFAQGIPEERVLHSPVSRLVVDVERYEKDDLEIMASQGMGAVYEHTSDGKQLRPPLLAEQRQQLMNNWYFPHHQRLTEAMQRSLDSHGQALLIDAHSFSSQPLPCDRDQQPDRPDICIGTDEFHTPPQLADALVDAFGTTGWTVKLNSPFAGALVPIHHYKKKRNLAAVMIEVNRALYIDETTGERFQCFSSVARTIREVVISAVPHLNLGGEG